MYVYMYCYQNKNNNDIQYANSIKITDLNNEHLNLKSLTEIFILLFQFQLIFTVFFVLFIIPEV